MKANAFLCKKLDLQRKLRDNPLIERRERHSDKEHEKSCREIFCGEIIGSAVFSAGEKAEFG